MAEDVYPLWGVVMGGPTLCGGVAVFSRECDALAFTIIRNQDNMYLPNAVKDSDGISKAWKMGDGKCWPVEITSEDQLNQFFVWE